MEKAEVIMEKAKRHPSIARFAPSVPLALFGLAQPANAQNETVVQGRSHTTAVSYRSLAIATMVAALLCGCSGDGGNADPRPRDTPNASSSTRESGETAAPDDPDRAGDPRVSLDIASGWIAEITDADDARLPTTGGPAVLVSRTPAQTTITGMVGQSGGSLTIGLKTFEVGESTAHDFNLGFRLQRYRCISQQVVVTLTQVEPKAKGTFSGPVSCEDLGGGADPVDATVSGEIAG